MCYLGMSDPHTLRAHRRHWWTRCVAYACRPDGQAHPTDRLRIRPIGGHGYAQCCIAHAASAFWPTLPGHRGRSLEFPALRRTSGRRARVFILAAHALHVERGVVAVARFAATGSLRSHLCLRALTPPVGTHPPYAGGHG